MLAFAEEFNIIINGHHRSKAFVSLILWAPYNFLGAQPSTCTYNTVLPFSNLQGKGNFGGFKEKRSNITN